MAAQRTKLDKAPTAVGLICPQWWITDMGRWPVRPGLPPAAGTGRLASKLVVVVSRRTSLNAGPDSPRSASRLAQPPRALW